MSVGNTRILMVQRPQGALIPSKTFHLDLSENISFVNIPEGSFLVRVVYLSVDPAMKGWMDDTRSYIEPVAIGAVMRSGGLGQVIYSKTPKFKVGEYVAGMFGWQKFALVLNHGVGISKIVVNVPNVKMSDFMSLLGMTGMTAYFGMMDIGKPKQGDTVVVSGAAGATGSIAGQIAKLHGCRVIGIAGTEDKCRWLQQELGFDVALNYKDPQFEKKLLEATPKHINVYFDNVGGDILDLCLKNIAVGARIVCCGAISIYNLTSKPKGIINYFNLIKFRAKMEGFIVTDYQKKFPEAREQLLKWISQGKIKGTQTIVQGIENAPAALASLFEGKNTGKLLVKVDDEVVTSGSSSL